MCCGQAVVIPWETKFEKPSNAGPGWQSSFQLDVQDDGIDIPYAGRQSWPEFGSWLAASFNLRDLFELQREKFRMLSQNPGERMHTYNIRWNLERDMVDELAVAELYPAGSVHEEELENTYIRSLVGPLSSKLYDLRAIQGTSKQVMEGARDTASGCSLSLGLQILQQHAVRLDNEQLIASELRKLQSPHATRTYPRRSFLFSSQRRTTQRITHLGAASSFSEIEDENTEQSQF